MLVVVVVVVVVYFVIDSVWKLSDTPSYIYSWAKNIGMYLREVGWEVVDWTLLTQVRDQWQTLVYMVMNLWVP
jgi:hypothetical protein